MQKPAWGLRATEDPLAPGVPGCPFSIQGRAAPEARALLIAAQVQESELRDALFCPDRRWKRSVELPTLMPKAGSWSAQHPLWDTAAGPPHSLSFPSCSGCGLAFCAWG